MRTSIVALIALGASLTSCSEPFGPEDTTGTYVLTRFGDVPMSDFVLTEAGHEVRVVFDSVGLRGDGLAWSHTRYTDRTLSTDSVRIVDRGYPMTWERVGASIELRSYCPQGWACDLVIFRRTFILLDDSLMGPTVGRLPAVFPRLHQHFMID